MLGEIVVHDQHVAAGLHEGLGDTGRGVGRDIRETGRVVTLRHDHDGVGHRPLFPKGGYGLRHGRSALADGAIDAYDILALLIENGIDCNGGLAGLAVPENQLTLPAPHGNERIDDLETGLERNRDGRALHDRRGGTLDWKARFGDYRTIAIQRPTQRVHDASEQGFAHGHIHNPAGTPDFIACMEEPVVPEQDDANLVRVHVERDSEHVVGEGHQLIVSHSREA